MSSDRNPGRYNLHRLGWSAFEDLCMQVMRVVLGETCSRYRPGPDGGRDGCYVGQASGKLLTQNNLPGEFVIQCKHTSQLHQPLDPEHLKTEEKKIAAIAAKRPCNYILLTNRQTTAPDALAVETAFEAIPNVGKCLVLAETWIEDAIDAHPRLLRLVPRLYGIGDLSQIISFGIMRQSEAVLEDLARPLKTFVPTESYRKAERALHERGFVVLVGPPASGKSAIAASLCLSTLAQDTDARFLRIEHADDFKDTWSPDDKHTIFWVDDVFGETTLDGDRLREWSAALDKVEAARKRGSKIVFCTRDYILSAAERKLKRSKVELLSDSSVRVQVDQLSEQEKEAILYNHIKDGDISGDQKAKLKRHLQNVSRFKSFSPELARRLGNRRFHGNTQYDHTTLLAFFDDPVRHFQDVIHGISNSESAALAVCLYNNNAVVDPIPDAAIAPAVLESFGVSSSQVREAFELLSGSLVKRARQGTAQTWQVHHPSMLEALQQEMAGRSSQLDLYIKSARINVLLRDTTTLECEAGSRLVFLPDSVYETLLSRLQAGDTTPLDSIARYLVDRASDAFLVMVGEKAPTLLDEALALVPEHESANVAPELAVRLGEVAGTELLTDRRRAIVTAALSSSVDDFGWSGFLSVEDFADIFSDFVSEYLKTEVATGFSSIELVYDWYRQDVSTKGLVDSALEALANHRDRLTKALSEANLAPENVRDVLRAIHGEYEARFEEVLANIREREEEREAHMADMWEEDYRMERDEIENSRFADVDQ